MALTKIGTNGVKDDAITSGKIPANAVGSSEIADQAVTLDKLPHGTSSNDGKFLRANNGADPSFETVSIPAGTTINNNANNRVITGSGTANTLEGESNLTFTGSNLTVTNGSGASELTLVTPSNTDGGVYFNDGSNSGAVSYQHSDNSMRFRVNSTEKMRIDSSGRVGIGTTSPSNLLHVKGSGHDKVLVESTGTSNAVGMQITHASGDSNQQVWQIQTGSGADSKSDLQVRDATSGAVEVTFRKGGGLTFNGDTAAANALDDYEEGTFTPTNVSGSGVSDSWTGRYTKIGNIVHFQINQTGGSYGFSPMTALSANYPYQPAYNGAFAVTNGNPNISGTGLTYAHSNKYLYWGFSASGQSYVVISGTYITS